MPGWLTRRGRVRPVGRPHRPPRRRRLRRRSNRRRKVPTTAITTGRRGGAQTAGRAPATRPPGGRIPDRRWRVPPGSPVRLTRHSTLRRRHREARCWVQWNPLPYSFPARHHARRAPVRGKFVGPRATVNGPATAATACSTPTVCPGEGRARGGWRLLATCKGGDAPYRKVSSVPKPPSVHGSHRRAAAQRSDDSGYKQYTVRSSRQRQKVPPRQRHPQTQRGSDAHDGADEFVVSAFGSHAQRGRTGALSASPTSPREF